MMVETPGVVAEPAPQDEARLTRERERLIDHFKRVYQIVVGIAITIACRDLFASGVVQVEDAQFWRFCAFLITVVPVFHGGDRSLDVKYLGVQITGFWRRAAYLWDVYMLLITAVLFVKIAQAITPSPSLFYQWMFGMLIFDVFVLPVDAWKNDVFGTQQRPTIGESYLLWILLNYALAAVCWLAAAPPAFLAGWSPLSIDVAVFACAFARTVADYVVGRRFMFP